MLKDEHLQAALDWYVKNDFGMSAIQKKEYIENLLEYAGSVIRIRTLNEVVELQRRVFNSKK